MKNTPARYTRTKLITEDEGERFDKTVNTAIDSLTGCDVLEIKFTATADKDGVIWFNALIIYEGNV